MSKFFRFFAERNLLAYMITLITILLGLSTLTHIKRDIFPDADFGEMVITTHYPGASPEDVELKVTNKIEEELKDVIGIKRFTSWSKENSSLIHIQIEPDEKDQDRVKAEIREAVNRVTDLPPEVIDSPLVTNLNTSVFPIIEVGLSAPDMSYPELREIARLFQKKLENVPGVTKIERYGYRAREIRVEVDPRKIIKHEVSLKDFINAISLRNIRATGGSFESYTSEKNIVTLAQFREPLQVGDVVVRTTFQGPLVKVKDLALVRDDFEDERIMSRMNGIPAISFIAHKSSSADIIRTIGLVHELIEKEKQLLPKGVEVLFFNDVSKYVDDRLNIVLTNGLIGLTMVLLVLSIFLNIRIAVWVALGVPIAILGTIFLLPVTGVFLDTVSLTAMVIVIGIIVDDAIIISESIYHRYEGGSSPLDAAVEGVSGVFKPVVTTILTTFVAFAPMFFMPGIMGKFVYVIPTVISLALFVSLMESTIALPAHLANSLRHHKRRYEETQSDHFFHRLRDRYRARVTWILRHRYLLIVSFLIVLVSAMYYAYRHMEFVLFPSSGSDKFAMLIQLPTGTSLQATADKVRELEQLVESLDRTELDSYVTRVGDFGDVVPNESENFAAIWVSLTPFASRERNADQIVNALREQTSRLKGYEDIFFMIDAGGPPVGRPIHIRVVGSDDEIRRRLSDDITAYVKTLEGTKDVDRNDKPGKEQIQLGLDYDKLARLGITVADIARHVRIAYDGEVVTSVRYGDEDVDFRVILQKEARKNPDYLIDLEIPNKERRLTPLRHVARLVTGPGPSNYYHYKGERSVSITGDVDKDVTTPIRVAQAVEQHFNLDRDYPGMRLVIGGEAEETRESVNELFSIFGIAALGIYFLLVLLFNSVWQPLMVMMAVPFGIIGVIFAFSVHGEPLGFLATTGVVGLSGVVVNDSLVLVNHINELRLRYPDRSLISLVAQGTADRLRAILLTTMSTVAGLLPLAYGVGGADPFMGPMALALGYGLLFATPLTLVLIPCLYLAGEDIRSRFSRPKFHLTEK